MRTPAQRAWSFYLRSCSARMCSKNNLLINSTAVNGRGHSFLISMNVYTVMKKVTWLQISTNTIDCEQHFLQPSAPIGFLRGTYISLWLATHLLTTRPHVLGGFYPMCWNSLWTAWEQKQGAMVWSLWRKQADEGGSEFSAFIQLQIPPALYVTRICSYHCCFLPRSTFRLLSLQIVMLISALCSHKPWLLPEVTGLEKLLLNLMIWVLSLRQRKLMTTATLLNSTAPYYRTWHLKPRLARWPHCLSDLCSLLPQSGWGATCTGSYFPSLLLYPMLSSHLALPYYLLLKASALLDKRKTIPN